MTEKQIIWIQKRVGTNPDGDWGPKSRAAAQAHLAKLAAKAPQNWPKQDEASLTAFYGKVGDELQFTNIDVTGLGVKYFGTPVTKIRVHKKCADSLSHIVKKLSTFEAGRRVLAQYAGVYNNRPMTGNVKKPSVHARAIGIDLMSATNGNSTPWPTMANMPFRVMEVFAAEGWLCAGVAWWRDAMHFQATQ